MSELTVKIVFDPNSIGESEITDGLNDWFRQVAVERDLDDEDDSTEWNWEYVHGD